MRTYWLVGEDPAQRLARIREEIVGSSLFSSISSDSKTLLFCLKLKLNFSILGLSDTPDLLRRPGANFSINGTQFPQESYALIQLHQRARAACSMHYSQVCVNTLGDKFSLETCLF